MQIQKGEYKFALKGLTELILSASNEVLILDYTPLAEKNNQIGFSHDELITNERRLYYDVTLDKIINGKSGSFHYQRIIQLPKGRQVSELFLSDPIFCSHCQAVVKISETRPDIASVKVGNILYQGTIMIIDQKILILGADIIDPDDQNYYDYGYFRFDDPSKKVIEPFLRYFRRADIKSRLMRPDDFLADGG